MTPAPDHVVVLKPGDSHLIKVDFQDAWWSVVKKEQGTASQARPMKLTELTREGLEFCLEYRSPERAACARLPRSRIDLAWAVAHAHGTSGVLMIDRIGAAPACAVVEI